MKTPNENDDVALFDLTAAQRYLGVGRTTFYELRQTGEIPEVRLTPRCLRFLKSDLDAYIQKRRKSLPHVLLQVNAPQENRK
jgi:excisionase family DNA binding protein